MHRVCDGSVDMAVVFPCLLAGIRLLVITVDAFPNHIAAVVCPPNLTCHLTKKANQARFVFRQQHTAAELRQVSSCRLFV
jgi:ADP-heptose:LPS heptosyltransferase